MELFLFIALAAVVVYAWRSRSQNKALHAFNAAGAAASWFDAMGIRYDTITFTAYYEPALVLTPGGAAIVGFGDRPAQRDTVGFAIEVHPGRGVVAGGLIEPFGIVTHHQRAASEARQSGVALCVKLANMSERFHAATTNPASEPAAPVRAVAAQNQGSYEAARPAIREVSNRAVHGRTEAQPGQPRQAAMPAAFAGEGAARLEEQIRTLAAQPGAWVISGASQARFIVVHGESMRQAGEAFLSWIRSGTPEAWTPFVDHCFSEPGVTRTLQDCETADRALSQAEAEVLRLNAVKPGCAWLWPGRS